MTSAIVVFFCQFFIDSSLYVAMCCYCGRNCTAESCVAGAYRTSLKPKIVCNQNSFTAEQESWWLC